jgi:hypothetical protein
MEILSQTINQTIQLKPLATLIQEGCGETSVNLQALHWADGLFHRHQVKGG